MVPRCVRVLQFLSFFRQSLLDSVIAKQKAPAPHRWRVPLPQSLVYSWLNQPVPNYVDIPARTVETLFEPPG